MAPPSKIRKSRPDRPSSSAQDIPTRESIRDDLIALGATEGDVLYLRCGLAGVGVRSRDVPEVFLNGIRDAIGAGGTIIAPAFTETSPRWSRSIAAFTLSSPPTTGAFSKILLAQQGAFRSVHPTHSFVGLGPRAAEFLGYHPHYGASFEPMRKVVEANGLMLVVGCVAESPGFSTVHLAQYDLGLSQRHWARYLFTVHVNGNERVKLVESPGCSRNFGIFYKDYIEGGNFAAGHVGNAWSIAVRAEHAYQCERARLTANPRYPVCDVPDCLSCRIMRGYNKRAIPLALLYRLRRVLSR